MIIPQTKPATFKTKTVEDIKKYIRNNLRWTMVTSNDHRWPVGSPRKGTVTPPVTGGFSAQRDSDAENISSRWRYNEQVINHTNATSH